MLFCQAAAVRKARKEQLHLNIKDTQAQNAASWDWNTPGTAEQSRKSSRRGQQSILQLVVKEQHVNVHHSTP